MSNINTEIEDNPIHDLINNILVNLEDKFDAKLWDKLGNDMEGKLADDMDNNISRELHKVLYNNIGYVMKIR